MGTVAERLAGFAADLQIGGGPAAHAARRLVLDTIAVGWAGREAPGIAAIREQALQRGGRAEARLWGEALGVPASEAAFANGCSVAALDFDAVHEGSILHADAVVLPAALAVAEWQGRSGQEFLSAYVAGIELAHRLSLATPRDGGWFGTSTAGVFGAAAAVARLMDLGAEGIHNALGIALSLSSGTKQAIVERTLTKRLQSAFAARSGVHAALAAAAGVTGPRDWLEGQFGWFSLYEMGDPSRVVDGLGSRFEFIETGIKKYPFCLCTHAAIDAAQALMSQHSLSASEIEGVEVTISPYMNRIVGGAFDPSGDAQVAGQFSIQYAVARGLAASAPGLEEIQPDNVRDPQIGRLARSVAIRIEPSWPGKLTPAAVAIRTARHGVLSRIVDRLPGSAERPLSDEELEAKATACLAAGGMVQAQIPHFIARISGIDSLARVSELFLELETAC
ncbi:MAG: MmgE/PrpD family protein [Alphaproteobacteria bacterium]|nr:MmgE/PrpD family protein [Alphaproteobacteria bacterium]